MSNPIGIAVVGLGLAGGAMVTVINAHPAFRLVAAVDPIDELRSAFVQGEGLPAFESLDELWSHEEVDAVYIATPHQLHRNQTVAACRAGRHVIVEKPMALSVEDCDAMVIASDTANVRLVVGHTHGFDPTVAIIADAVRTGTFGDLGMIAMWNYTDFLYRPRRPEELDESKGGGILYNQIPHQVDIVRTITSSPVRAVRALTSRLDPDRPVAGSCAVLLELDSGVAASIVYSGYDQFDTDELYEWVGEGGAATSAHHGRTRSRVGEMSAEQETHARVDTYAYGRRHVGRPPQQPHFGELVVTCADGDLRPRPDGVAVYGRNGASLLPTPPTVWAGRGDVLDEMALALSTGQRQLHDGRFGRETVRICQAIVTSVESGEEVHLTHLRGEHE